MSTTHARQSLLNHISIVLLSLVYTGICFGQSTWEQISPSYPYPLSSMLWATYANDRFIVVGEHGMIFSSPNGSTWTKQNSGTARSLTTIAGKGEKCVAVGDYGTILTSPDGSLWTKQNSGTAMLLTSIACNDERCVAVGDSGTILTSPDGTTWQKSDIATQVRFTSVTCSKNRFIAAGDSGTIATSTDGLSWTTVKTGADNSIENHVFYGNNLFVAKSFYDGPLRISTDGLSWTQIEPELGSDPDTVIADEVVHRPYFLDNIFYGNGKFVAVGETSPGWTKRIFISSDCKVWTKSGPDLTAGQAVFLDIRSVTYGNNRFVAITQNSIFLGQPEGDVWNKSCPTLSQGDLRQVSYCNGTFVALEDAGTILLDNDLRSTLRDTAILTSTNGTTWTRKKLKTAGDLNAIASDTTRFVAVGDSNTIVTSTDGSTWTIANSGIGQDTPTSLVRYANNILSITYENGLFVALRRHITNREVNGGSEGMRGDFYRHYTLTSPDGTTWSPRDSAVDVPPTEIPHGVVKNTTLTSIACGNGTYVIVGNKDTIYTSTDNINWSTLCPAPAFYPKTVTHADNLFVAVGDTYNSSGTILTSPDGTNWTNHKIEHLYTSLNSITYGNKRFVVVGNSGAILSSSDGSTWTENPTTMGDLLSVTYGNDRFVAVGRDGLIITSKADVPGSVHASYSKQTSMKIKIISNRISALFPDVATRNNLKITLLDLAGRKIRSFDAAAPNGSLNFPVKGVPAGMYFVTITDGGRNTLSSAFVFMR